MYTLSYRDRVGVVHIVAMPKGPSSFTACGAIHFDVEARTRAIHFVPGVATCVRCWAREFLEWEWEANTTPERFMR